MKKFLILSLVTSLVLTSCVGPIKGIAIFDICKAPVMRNLKPVCPAPRDCLDRQYAGCARYSDEELDEAFRQALLGEDEQSQEKNQVDLCGNGRLDAGEECDGAEWGDTQSCRDFDYDSGLLFCGFDCQFDTSACSYTEQDVESSNQTPQSPTPAVPDYSDLESVKQVLKQAVESTNCEVLAEFTKDYFFPWDVQNWPHPAYINTPEGLREVHSDCFGFTEGQYVYVDLHQPDEFANLVASEYVDVESNEAYLYTEGSESTHGDTGHAILGLEFRDGRWYWTSFLFNIEDVYILRHLPPAE